MADKFIACTHRLHVSQVIYLTFQTGPSGITGLEYLIKLTQSNHAIRIQGAMIGLLAVTQSGEWQRVSRTVAVYGLMNAENNELATISSYLENVSAGDHIASKLFTSNPKKRGLAASELIESIGSELFIGHIKDWGCTSKSELVDFEGLPGIKFSINSADDQSRIVEVILDGFSGRMAVDGKFGDMRCSHPDQIRKVIVEALIEKLECMTAV